MFEGDYTMYGKHARYTIELVKNYKIFERYIDVYMLGAIIGYSNGLSVEKDNDNTYRARIYADAFSNENANCTFIYRLIMLLDDASLNDIDKRIERAFRDDSEKENEKKMEENMNIFNSYVRGGIEILYENIINNKTSLEEFVDNIYKFVKISNDVIKGINYDQEMKNILYN